MALPQRAAVAAGVDLDDLAGLYDLRRIVECEVIERSIESMTDEQVDGVRAALEALEAVAQDHDSPAFWELHRDVPLGAARSGRDAPGSGACCSRCGRRRSATSGCSSPRRSDDAMADHRQLYEYCVSRDGASAREVLRRHLDRTESAVREAFTPTGETESAG